MKQRRKKKYRILAAFLCFCILFTLPGISDVFMVAAAEREESAENDNIIVGFYPLAEEVMAQAVSVGADLDEINLPDELTVHLGCGQESTDQKAEENGQDDTEGDDTEADEDTTSDETAGVQEEDADDTVDMEHDEDPNEESVPVDERENETTQETYTVTLPEYQAGNVITVKTLENTRDAEPENAAEKTVTISGVTWQSEPAYDGNTEGTYIFTAVLPGGYALAEGVSLPQITVTVGGKTDERFSENIMMMAETPAARVTVGGTSTEYTSFTTAWSKAQNTDSPATVTLLDDVTFGGYLKVQAGSDIILEGGQYKLTFTSSKDYMVVVENGVFTLKSGTLSSSGAGINNVKGTVNILGGVLKSEGRGISNTGTVIMSGGEVQVGKTTDSYGFYGGGNLTISGGKISGYGGVRMYGGTLSITGGEVSGDRYGLYIDAASCAGSLSGGTFSCTGTSSAAAAIYIDKAVNKDVADLLAEGFAYFDADYIQIRGQGISGKTLTETVTVDKDSRTELKEYTITYDYSTNGGGSATKTSDTAAEDEKIDLTPTATMDGWEFLGWNTDQDAKKGLTSLRMGNGDVTLFAIYSKDIRKEVRFYYVEAGECQTEFDNFWVTLYNNESDNIKIDYDFPQDLLDDEEEDLGIDGYTAYGFGESASSVDEEQMHTDYREELALDDVREAYYGVYRKEITVSYDANGGSGSVPASQAVTTYAIASEDKYTLFTKEEDAVTLPEGNGLALPGYVFAGWMEGSAAGEDKAAGTKVTPTEDIVYYAKWTTKTCTVSFDYQGATGGNNTERMNVTYDAAYGTLPTPTRTGYAFLGWYTQAGGQGERIESTTVVKNADAHTLYAYWKDDVSPDSPVCNTVLPADWTNKQTVIPLKLHDSVGVTELWVSIDGNAYIKADGFTGGTGTVAYDYPVTEGEHTYQFKVKDAAGNTSAESDVFTVKLDTAKPVIGAIRYENRVTTLWNWIIGKKSLIIHVPVTDEGSGVEEISCTMTPTDAAGNADSSKAVTKTASVEGGGAQITFDADFRGTLAIMCTDQAGNAADSVTVGADGGGVIAEDRAPVITTDVKADYYDTAMDIAVTVRDDTENTVAAGIATVTWQVGDGTPQSVNVDASTLQTAAQAVFTIPASEIPTGITEIKIRAVDNAGNENMETITVKVKGPEKQPAAEINYREEKLTGLVPGRKYIIEGREVTADREGCVPVDESWFGKTVSIIGKGSGSETGDSPAQNLSIPAKPAKSTPTGVDADTPGGTGKLVGLTANVTYEISTDGGSTWETKTADADGAITGLAPGTYTVRVKAGASNFAGEPSAPAVIGAYKVTVTFIANGETYKTFTLDYGGTLSDIPAVPPKKDAGDRTYIGEWCMNAAGTPAVFTNITADMTVYAVYTGAYKVTLQSGTGYTLSAEHDSASPVKEGGSFTFRFTLSNGYEKTGNFTVKVNGAAVELSGDGTYTISGITEDKTVTVEGVRKKSGAGGGTDNDKDKKPDGDNPGDKEEGTGQQTDPAGTPKQPDTPTDKSNPPKPSDPPKSSAPPADTPWPGTQPADRPGTKPGIQEEKPESMQPEGTGEPERTENSDGTGQGQPPQGEPEEMSAAVENGKIVTAAGAVRTGNVKDMTSTSSALLLGNGAVIVTVVCEGQACTAGVADTAAVANAVLMPEQIAQADSGETIEIRIDVTDISGRVPEQDKEVIEKGMEEYRKEVPGLTLGMYVDISMFIRIGSGGWNAVTATGEPVEVIIGIPEALQEADRIYYIIRAHEGEYTLLDDTDETQDTITIGTERFSSYAIAYEEAEGAADEKCGLCRICPTFLGICLFIWLVVIIVLFLIIGFIIWRNRRGQGARET